MSDDELLEGLEHKRRIVRDRTLGVAEGFSNGFYLWGEGGTSKSYTVEEILKESGKPYMLSNSRLTARGLFNLLRDHPDVVHLFEDVESLFDDNHSPGVLRSALWGQAGRNGQQERLIVWQTAHGRDDFLFAGGIILVANCPLENIPQLRALKTRLVCLQYQPTNQEIEALMRQIARQGHQHGSYRLTPDECQEVTSEIIARSRRLERNLDLRMLINAYHDRLQWANGLAETHWLDLLESRIRERIIPNGCYLSRAGQKETELNIVRRIVDLAPAERVEAWKKETGKSQAALYRRLKELGEGESHFSHNQNGEN